MRERTVERGAQAQLAVPELELSHRHRLVHVDRHGVGVALADKEPEIGCTASATTATQKTVP